MRLLSWLFFGRFPAGHLHGRVFPLDGCDRRISDLVLDRLRLASCNHDSSSTLQFVYHFSASLCSSTFLPLIYPPSQILISPWLPLLCPTPLHCRQVVDYSVALPFPLEIYRFKMVQSLIVSNYLSNVLKLVCQ